MFNKRCLNRLIHMQTHAIIENVSCIAVPQHRVLAGYTSASECFSSPLCSCSSAPFLINGLDKLACSEKMKWLLINDNVVLIYKITVKYPTELLYSLRVEWLQLFELCFLGESGVVAYSQTSSSGHLSTKATSFFPAGANSPYIDSYLNLSTTATVTKACPQLPK